uniref:RNA polymerase I-specific transcription initiation factor RRN3 isoform X2 n=1 Tax=Myxine glutinosa TaxID=7769 RepID=UPI00358DDFD9
MLGDSPDFLSSPPRKTVRFGTGVIDALTKYKQGQNAEYNLLLHQLADPEIKDAQLINWLQEMRNAVVYLTKDVELLVSLLLRIPWLTRSKEVIEEYLAFLTNLVSAQTIYLRSCLKMLVSNFTGHVKSGFDICHRGIQFIIRLVPLTPTFLMPILVEKFPFVAKSARTQECYLHNLLQVTTYLPALRKDILLLLLEKLLKLDVSVSRMDIEEAEETAKNARSQHNNANGEMVFNMDEDVTQTNSSVDGDDEESMAHTVADTLDILMDILFSYIRDVCLPNGQLDMGKAKELYRDLLVTFDRLLLPTRASCHVQFYMLYFCSFRLAFAEAFLDHLWKTLQNPSQPSVLRQAAAAYLGSLLARAAYIPSVTVRACLDLMVSWLHRYIDSQDGSVRSYCDVSVHGPFYAVCQAVCYIFIFRHRDLLDQDMKKGLAYLQALNLERLVHCRLNPLKVCLPAIVRVFAALTRKYQIAFCYTLIERNRRQVLPMLAGSEGDARPINTNPLDSFFPYDPYVLKRSSKAITPLYRTWTDDGLHEPGEKDRARLSASEDGNAESDDDFLKAETPNNNSGTFATTPSFHNRTSKSFDSSPCRPPSFD